MNKSIKRIYINDWLTLKPYKKQMPTDSYYLQISNKVKKAIFETKESSMVLEYLDEEDANLLACFLTSYFEDLVSGSNLWNAFVAEHKVLYKKALPFYDTDEYYEEEINIQDVSFLIWYFANTYQTEQFILPFNSFIIEIAIRVMDVFEEEWEYAPENKTLLNFYTIDEEETDYYVARELIDKILFNSYLFFPDTQLDLNDSVAEIMNERGYEEKTLMFLNENRDSILHNSHTALLSYKGSEWAARIIGKSHKLHNDYLNISPKISGYFLYKGQDENYIFIEHIASGKKFKLTKKSFDYASELKEIDKILYIGIVKWRNEWWFSGINFSQDFNPDLILDEKNSMRSRMAVSFLDNQTQQMKEVLDKQFKAFLDFTNGSQIAFVESGKIEEFLKDYMEHYEKCLKLSVKKKEDAKKRARTEGYFGEENKEPLEALKGSGNGLIFFNPKSGTEIALDMNSAFPAPENPFFNKEMSEEHIIRMLLSEEQSKELVMYCIDNFKSQLPFFETENGGVVLEDIDFLLRFWKKSNYFTKPSITFTGNKENNEEFA